MEKALLVIEEMAAIALQTGRAKDRERVIKLMEEADLDRSRLGRILAKFKLTGKLKNLEKLIHEK